MYTNWDDNNTSDHLDFPYKLKQATRRLPRSLDEAASTFPGWTFPGNTIQATMQVTGTTALEPVASDQSLAWPFKMPERKMFPPPHVVQPATLQATRLIT